MTRWIHISDLQLGLGKADNDESDELAADLVQAVLEQGPDFVIHSGDCIHGTPFDSEARDNPEYAVIHEEFWQMYQNTIRPLRDHCPVFSVVGNHDHTMPELETEKFCHYNELDDGVPYFSRIVGDVQVICLDAVPGRHLGGFPAGTEQDAWLRRKLERTSAARCRVAVGHYPIFLAADVAYCVDSSLGYDEEAENPGNLLPLLCEHNVDLYLCGHLHVYERARYERLTQVVAGANHMAYPGMLEMRPSRFLMAQDERPCYISFTLAADRIEAEAISLSGERIDAWCQPLNDHE
jgi:UDP-2,3-diacylglucosamine pyrophosphatase LpxH